MGLIKAAMGAASGVMGDQWKEYFYCDALPAEVLAVKGQKRTNGRSANRHGSENVISDGSVIAVADGQCVLIVEQGKVVDLCAEPGEYTYSTGTQPSLLSGGLKDIDSVFAELGKRFSQHMDEKYSRNGYIRLWIPNSPNEKALNELRNIIEDKTELRKYFEKIFEENS